MEINEYTFVFVLGLFFAFMDAYGIGANDVANSFSTSVASKSLTLAQACGIAVFTEFLGAFLMGSNTADTIRNGIIDIKLFASQPELLMFAMLCALVGSSVWIIFATRRGWPVSTTHSIVGATIGVGISAFGVDSISWGYNGVAKIVTSWFVSPVAAGIVASFIYLVTKYAVLTKPNSFERGLVAIPIYFGITIFVDVFYILFKGSPRLKMDKKPIYITLLICFGCALFVMLFCWFFVVPWLRRRLEQNENLRWYHVFVTPFLGPRPQDTEKQMDDEPTKTLGKGELDLNVASNEKKSLFQRTMDVVLHGIRKDVLTCDTPELQRIHDAAIQYDNNTEYMYSFLQVITASMASFAHGSNDVANAVGPLSTIFYIWETATVDITGKTPVPLWVLAFGGIAIDIGLLTYGYNIMRSLGNKITYHSPSRGFSMELGTSLTVLTCSKIGLPVSTTHCITGATAAVGLCNGTASSLNWKMLGWCFFSWILTLPCAGLIAGLLFAFVANAPKFA